MNLTFNNIDATTLDQHRYTLRDVTDALGYDWGMREYPIFDEAYRETLNRAIWNHFALRRIASDTPSNFIFYLNRRMQEQMPNVNPIYELVRDEEFNPLSNSQGQSETKAATAQSSTTRAIASETPQVFLDNPDGEQYLTGVNKQDGSGTGDSDSKTKYSSISGSPSNVIYDMLSSSFMATDNLVFELLEPLFMQFWDDMPM